MYTVIESLTKDGRDRSLDYKITGFNVPRDSGTRRFWKLLLLVMMKLFCRKPLPAYLSRPTLIMYYVTLVPVILWLRVFLPTSVLKAQYVTPVIWDTW